MGGNDKEFLSFINNKKRESLPNILVTRNPNWFHSSGKGTDCVKGMY
jgi:hypothetical protein